MLKKALEINPGNQWARRALMVVYGEMGNHVLRKEYEAKAKQDNQDHYGRVTTHNFRRFKEILNRRKMPWICVQYPMRSIEPLKKIFEREKDMFFVDNEEIFKSAVLREGWKEYFTNLAAGDFGYCTEKGNRLLAQNIANVILKEVFEK